MTIRVGQVEEPLAPFGIARCRVRTVADRDQARVEGIDVGMVKNDASPHESVEQVRRIIVERGLDRLLKDEVVVPMKRKS